MSDAELLLNELSELQAARSLITMERESALEQAVPEEIRVKIAAIEEKYDSKLAYVDGEIVTLTKMIHDAVLAAGSTVKGTHLMAVWSKGRVSWDSKKLDGMMSLIPQLKDARKEGEPSVTIRKA